MDSIAHGVTASCHSGMSTLNSSGPAGPVNSSSAGLALTFGHSLGGDGTTCTG